MRPVHGAHHAVRARYSDFATCSCGGVSQICQWYRVCDAGALRAEPLGHPFILRGQKNFGNHALSVRFSICSPPAVFMHGQWREFCGFGSANLSFLFFRLRCGFCVDFSVLAFSGHFPAFSTRFLGSQKIHAKSTHPTEKSTQNPRRIHALFHATLRAVFHASVRPLSTQLSCMTPDDARPTGRCSKFWSAVWLEEPKKMRKVPFPPFGFVFPGF